MNVRNAFYEVLRAHGITTIFGNPGSNELPVVWLLAGRDDLGSEFAGPALSGITSSGWGR